MLPRSVIQATSPQERKTSVAQRMVKTKEVLTIDELSRYLRIPKSTLYKLVQESRIPGQKIGRQWRFSKEAIDRWLEKSDGQSCTCRSENKNSRRRSVRK